MIKEESDYHDLESVVQQVEQNLERMTVSRQAPGSQWGVGGASLAGHCRCLLCHSPQGTESCPGGTWVWVGPGRPAVSRAPHSGLPSWGRQVRERDGEGGGRGGGGAGREGMRPASILPCQ